MILAGRLQGKKLRKNLTSIIQEEFPLVYYVHEPNKPNIVNDLYLFVVFLVVI